MIATEELRRLLDERGVEYTFDHGCHEFFWDLDEAGSARAGAIGLSGRVHVVLTGITPEQAIAATLGSGTCHNVSTTGNFRCSECDAADLDFDKPSFCHGCGARVVDA